MLFSWNNLLLFIWNTKLQSENGKLGPWLPSVMIYMISESLPLCGGHWLTVNTDKDNQHNVGYWNQMKTIPGINERVIFQLTNSPVIAQMFELLKRTPIKKILLSLFLSLFLNILFWMIYMYIWNHFMFIKFQRCADGLSLHVNPITSER